MAGLVNEVQLRMLLQAEDGAGTVIQDLIDKINLLKDQLAELADINPFAKTEESAVAATDELNAEADAAQRAGATAQEAMNGATTAAAGTGEAINAISAFIAKFGEGFQVSIGGAKMAFSDLSAQMQQLVAQGAMDAGELDDAMRQLAPAVQPAVDAVGQLQDAFTALRDELAVPIESSGLAVLADQASATGAALTEDAAAGGAAVASHGGGLSSKLITGGVDALVAYLGLGQLQSSAMSMVALKNIMGMGNFTPGQAERLMGEMGAVGINSQGAYSQLQGLHTGLRNLFTITNSGTYSKNALLLQSLASQSGVEIGPQIATETVGQQIQTFANLYQHMASKGQTGSALSMLNYAGISGSMASLIQNYGTLHKQFSGFNLGISKQQVSQESHNALSAGSALSKLSMEFGALGAAVAPLVSALATTLAPAVQKLTPLLGALGQTISTLVVALDDLVGKSAAARLALISLAGALALLSAVKLATNILTNAASFVSRLGQLGTGLTKGFGDLQAAFSLFTEAVGAQITKVGTAIGQWASQFGSTLSNWVSSVAGGVAKWVSQATAGATQMAAQFGAWVAETAASVSRWAISAAQWAAQTAASLASWIAETAVGVAEWVAAQAAAAAEQLAALAAAAAPLLAMAAPFILAAAAIAAAVVLVVLAIRHWSAIKRIAEEVGQWVVSAWDAIRSPLHDWQAIRTAADAVGNWMRSAYTSVVTSIDDLGTNLQQALLSLVQRIQSAAEGIIGGIESGLGGMASSVGILGMHPLSGVGNSLSSAGAENQFLSQMAGVIRGQQLSSQSTAMHMAGPGNTIITINVPINASATDKQRASVVAQELVRQLKLRSNVDLSF